MASKNSVPNPQKTKPASASAKTTAGKPVIPAPKVSQPVRILVQLQRFFWDFGGIIFLALALMTLLALLAPGWTGGVLAWWVNTLMLWLGWGSVWVVSTITVIGLWMLTRRGTGVPPRILWGRVLALELAAFSSIGLLAVMGGASIGRAEASLDGGRIGWGLAELMGLLLEPVGLSGLFFRGLILIMILGLSLITGLGFTQALTGWGRRISHSGQLAHEPLQPSGPVMSESPLQSGKNSPLASDPDRKKRQALPPEYRKNLRVESEAEETSSEPRPRDERLPPLDLLSAEQSSRPDERNINLTAGLIEKSLAEFGIPAKVVGFRVGPTVTQYAVEPGFVEKDKGVEGDPNRQKVRVAQISALARDLSLALSAERLRIEAPVPGRPYVGIEVPNSRSTLVRLRPILESESFHKTNSSLAIALGRDVSGQAVVADLSRMPHLLVAGTTGSGKSVCIAAITTCLVMNNTPDDLRLVMIDPKMVELVRFNGLPHLLGKVETELERILAVLRWTVLEMERRYKLLEATHSRNIDTYNRRARKRGGIEYLPYIVLLIDELADLMMSAPDQTEHNLIRLAQMARATGIHLVVATQRPSTDVVTGLIKANFPARISFAVTSAVDSRVILDTGGAEALLGRGDMLFTPPEASAPIRSQGAMVSDLEIEKVITYWQKIIPSPLQPATAPWDAMLEDEQVLADKDQLIEKAIAVVRETQRASASLLQRRLRIGYPRAARLVDELEEMGIVGPSPGGGRDRDVLIDKDDSAEYDLEE